MPRRRFNAEDHDTSAAKIISFIIRVGREETNPEKGQAIWRGHITPIPKGKRCYFSDISDIPAFIDAHLKDQC